MAHLLTDAALIFLIAAAVYYVKGTFPTDLALGLAGGALLGEALRTLNWVYALMAAIPAAIVYIRMRRACQRSNQRSD
jgi:hypothetical protein